MEKHIVSKTVYVLSDKCNIEIGFLIQEDAGIMPVLKIVNQNQNYGVQLEYEDWINFCNLRTELKIRAFSHKSSEEEYEQRILLTPNFSVKLVNFQNSLLVKLYQNDPTTVTLNESECCKIYEMQELITFKFKQMKAQEFYIYYNNIVSHAAESLLNQGEAFEQLSDDQKMIEILALVELRIGGILFNNVNDPNPLSMLEIIKCCDNKYVQDVLQVISYVQAFRNWNMLNYAPVEEDSDYHSQ